MFLKQLFRSTLALFMVGMAANAASAQVAAYSFSQSAGTYTPITGGTSFVMTDDDEYTATIPSFTFNGTAHTNIAINTNGYVVLGNNALAGTYSPVSSSAAAGGVIAPFGRDLDISTAGTPEIRLETVGNEVVVQWQDVSRYYATPVGERLSFQVRMNTVTGVIRIVYGGTIVPGTNTTYPQVGLRGTTNTDFNNRSVLSATGAWLNSVAGTANNNTCYFNSANSATVPSVGTTFQWTPPTCFAPSGFAAAVQNGSTVNFSWTNSIASGQIVVVVGAAAPSTGTPSMVSGTTATVGSLISGTGYRAYIREICGVGDTSAWSPFVAFTPACPIVSGVSVAGISPTAASFAWTTTLASGQIVVVPQGSAASTGIPSAVSGTTAMTSTLTPATNYSAFFRRICGAGDTSAWTSATNFSTPCLAVNAPWSDDLESITITAPNTQTNNALPTCWSSFGGVAGVNGSMTYNRAPRSGSKTLNINWSTTAGSGDYLYTPGINLSAGQPYRFSFWYKTDGISDWDTIRATVGTSPTTAAMSVIGTPVYATTITAYTQMTAEFTPSTSGVYYFGANVWEATTGPWYVTFDDFAVEILCPTVSLNASSNAVACAGGSTGSATVSASLPSYSFVWSDGQSGATANNLTAGVYTVTATDGGCSATTSVTISEPSAVTASIASSNPTSCNGGSNGTATGSATGGSSPYTFAWTGSRTGATVTNFAAGSYNLTATDVNGCTSAVGFIISEPSAVTASIASSSPTSCNGANDGSATANATGGTSPYTFAWTGSRTGATVSDFPAGVYSVTATDDNGCVSTSVGFTITEPAVVNASISSSNNPTGCTTANGSATANATGGPTGQLVFLWSNGQTTATATGLGAGTFTVTATIGTCSATTQVTLNAPAGITLTPVSLATNCAGTNTGFGSVNVAGGTAPFTFLWSDGRTDQTITNFAPGTYSITVADAGGCSNNANITITDAAPLVATTTVSNASCATCADGSATASSSGGTGSVRFLWSDGQTTATATGLLTGNYDVTVTDGNSCQTTASASVGFTIGVVENGNTQLAVRLFPNPTTGIITLENLPANARITLLNALGQEIRSIESQQLTEQLDLSDLPAATYLLRIQSASAQTTLPVVRIR